MPKRGMAPIRRKQLVDAAMKSIHEDGFASATVARIARHAGVSSGIVHHYFADKDELLFATLRALLAEMKRDVVQRFAAARTRRERIYAIIDASFGDGQFAEEVFSAWLALYGNAHQSERLQRIIRLYYRRLHANLMFDLRQMVSVERAEEIAEGITALIDGLWLRYALAGSPGNPEHPRRLTRAYLDVFLPDTVP